MAMSMLAEELTTGSGSTVNMVYNSPLVALFVDPCLKSMKICMIG